MRKLNRNYWLAQALDVLAKQGIAEVRVERLAKKIGVTNGGFYWQFKNHRDLLKGLLAYWAAELTGTIVERINQAQGDARHQLCRLQCQPPG